MPYSDIGGRGLARICRNYSQVDWIKCIRNRLLRAARPEAGITLIETVMAIAIFGIVSTALIGMLTSATAADGLARQKTIGLQLAQQQVEYVRQLGYLSAGTVDGNPTGVVAETQTKRVMGLWYALNTRIKWVNDPIPTSFATQANYKQVRVTVSRARDDRVLASVSTYLSSSTRLYSGGLNNAVINVTAVDAVLNTPLPGVTIHLYDGQPLSSSGVTDETGAVTFAGLLSNPDTGVNKYYDVVGTLLGYTTFKEDLPPGLPSPPGVGVPPGDQTVADKTAHVHLAPSETRNVPLRLYKSVTINVEVKNSDGSHPATSTVSIGTDTSGNGAEDFVVTNGFRTITTLGGYPIAPSPPNPPYVLSASTADLRFSPLVSTSAPDLYPSILFTTVVLTLADQPAPQNQTFLVTVKRYSCGSSSTIEKNARVNVTGGPSSISLERFTGHNGEPATFTTPFGSGYSIAAYTSRPRSGRLSGLTVDSSTTGFCVAVN
jgi:type II secretory pathway pseudopilin PulG